MGERAAVDGGARYCAGCGSPYPEAAGWPRRCASCGATAYGNPIPVVVVLAPVADGHGGLIAIRRGQDPYRGRLALPGGFVEHGETWQQAAARELREETGIAVRPDDVQLFQVASALADNTLLLFALTPPLQSTALPPFQPSAEVAERLVLREAAPLAFPLHEAAVRAYFDRPER
jgi:ADP-ribose pyrophosphatase YjhB (NUDIX family)